MAGQARKSQAEKAADSKNKSKSKSNTKKQPQKKPVKPEQEKKKSDIPVRVITSIVFILLFILFLVIAFVPDGVVVDLFASLLYGLLGQVAFTVSIPGLLALFLIHAFSGTRPIKMRTVCVILFVLACGCVAHLGYDTSALPENVGILSELYVGGISGTTAGLLCGGLAMLLRALFGTVLTYIILVIAMVLTLLGSLQITIPSIVQAIKDRPRPDWDDQPEKPEPQEPAAVVVNHIANKRIAYMERRRQVAEEQAQDTPGQSTETEKSRSRKVQEIMQQIDGDVDDPVAASGTYTPAAPVPEIPIQKPAPAPKPVPTPEPQQMPPFDINEVEQIQSSVPAPDTKKVKVTAQDAEESAAEVAEEIAQAEAVDKPVYNFPPVDLLKLPAGFVADGTEEMRENSRRLNETLASFRIEAHIVNVTRGPSVTRYEVELEKGVRLNKITNAAVDIALSLGAPAVRIAAVPGKISVVGIEVPNRAVTTVSLREVIDSDEFSKAKSKSSFAVGKDIGGSCIVGNIAKLPHMLIAGTTGSGKSVCMNSIIISLLYKASPDDVKLIMVDPKMVELGIYNGIPHLLIPVVTDPKKAAGSLQWAVTEMLRRYRMMSDAGVRDLEAYNSSVENQEVEGQKLPQVVVIIDELADLMLVAAKEVEESICRIAQMGRAAGIHLVIATQRPSADVITGLMKANIPSRIAFSVASAMESRIILDTQGAEKLVGRGDMLFAPIGAGKPTRVQGCFVSDQEVEAVASYVKANYVSNYDQQVMDEIEKKAAQSGNKAAATAVDAEPTSDEMAGDEMLPAAVDVILEIGQASVSMLQRRLKLGYARAARIVDEMEEMGIVGPYMGSKPRAILVTKEQWENMKNGQTSQLGFEDLPADEDPGSEDFS